MFEITLPSDTKVCVVAPNFNDRQNAVIQFRAVREQAGYSLEELIAANAITSINGIPITRNFMTQQNPLAMMNNWSIKDVNFFMEVFMSAFFMDEQLRARAADEAKKLMGYHDPTTTEVAQTLPASPVVTQSATQ